MKGALFTKAVSIWGPEFDAAMAALMKDGKRPARMQTWYCDSDKQFHVLVGRLGCTRCGHYEKRVELD